MSQEEKPITTRTCQEFLVEHFRGLGKEVSAAEFSRYTKYQDSEGNWQRCFAHPSLGETTVIECDGELSVMGYEPRRRPGP